MSSDYLYENNHLWAGVAARFVDNTVRYSEEANILLQPILFVASRLVCGIVFPILAAIDYISYKTQYVKERLWAKLSKTDADTAAHLQTAQKANAVAIRCFLGVIGSPVGLIYPDGPTQHFVPSFKKDGEVWNSSKKYFAKNATVITPKVSSIKESDPAIMFKEVADIIQNASKNKQKVAVAGAGMSQGKQNLPLDGQVLIDMQKINHVVIDPKTKIAKIGAGATWKDVQTHANPFGLAVQVMQASNVFSVGGSLSVNCHGWDHHMGSLGNTVEAITIVDAKGQVRRLTKADEEFKYVIGGYGGFGVIVEAEIKLTDNVKLTSTGTEIPPKSYYQYFQTIKDDPKIAMHLYRLSLDPDNLFKTGIAVNYMKLHGDEPSADPVVDEPLRGKTLERVELHAARRLPKKSLKLAWKLEKSGAQKPYEMTRNQIMRPSINATTNNSRIDSEWLQEYFVPCEKIDKFIEFLGGKLTENEMRVFNASVRYVKQDKVAELGYARDGDRFALVLFFNQHLNKAAVSKTEGWIKEVNDWLAENGGTYYMPYQPFDTQEQLEKCYPNFKHVVEKKKELDPENIFYNGLWERIAPAA